MEWNDINEFCDSESRQGQRTLRLGLEKGGPGEVDLAPDTIYDEIKKERR